jgi:hypothetical protein
MLPDPVPDEEPDDMVPDVPDVPDVPLRGVLGEVWACATVATPAANRAVKNKEDFITRNVKW